MAIGNPISLTSNVEGKNISVIATADQTQFTVTGGYRINQITVFRNGVRLVDGRDYTAADASTVTLNSGAIVGDVIEFQVFDDFSVADALNVNNGGTVNGNVTVTGILSTTNLSIGSSIKLDSTSGIVTAKQFVGNVTGAITGTASTATNAEGLTGTPDITVNNIVASGATFSGVVTYEDVTNIDSLGIVTARTGVDITANGLVVNAGVTTLAADLSIADKIIHSGDTNTAIRFPSTDTVTVETAGVQRLAVDSTGDLGLVGIATATGLVVVAGSGVYAGHAGVVTAVTFDGNLTGNVTGNADTATTSTNVTVADESSDTSCNVLFTTAATGNLPPKSGTNLTFNSSSGALTATSFVGALTGAVTGNADTATTSTNVTVADESSDTSCNVLFTTAATGNLPPKSGTNLTFNSSSGALTATSFVGALTGNVTGNISGGTVAGSTGSFTGDVDVADKIVHTGDTNTALRFPAADTFTVETGGSERLRITSAGLIGIGSDVPAHKLDVNGTGVVANLKSTNNNYALQFAGNNCAYDVYVGSDDSNNFLLSNENNDGTFTERLRIDSDGKILAGHTADISGGGLQVSGSANAGNAGFHRFDANDSGPFIQLLKSRNGTVGSNTVVQSGDELGTINFQGADGTDYHSAARIAAFVDGTPGNNDMPGRLAFSVTADGAAAPTERLRIKSDGTLHSIKSGTQITNADQTVAVFQRSSASGSTSKISIVSGNGASSHVNFGDTDDEDIGQLLYDHSDNSMQFLTNTAEAMRIDSSGRLGLGTQSPNNALTINSATNAYMVQTRTNCSSIVGPAGTSASDGVLFGTTTNSPFIFYVNSSEKGRVDSSGRLLVDTTADRPIEQPFGNGLNSAQPGKIVVEDSGAGTLNLIVARENQSNAYGPAISLVKSRGTSDGSYTIVQAGDNLGTIQFGGADGSADRVGAAIVSQVDSTPGSDDMPGRLMFATTPDGSGHPIERLRITKDGHLSLVADDQKMIFGAGDDAEFTCDGTDFFLNLNSGINDFKIRDGTTLRFTFDDAGDFTATGNVTAYSDITLKDNIETIPNALDKVLNLRGVQFDRIDREDNPHEIGVIAQEVEEVIPEVVLTHEDGLKSVAYGNLVGLLIESIKELKAEVNDLKAQLEG